MLKTIFCFGYFAMLLFPLNVYCASYYGNGAYGDIGVGLRYDSNLSRAQIENDRKEDFINSFSAQYGYQKVLSERSLLNVSAEIIYERMNEYTRLNNVQFGGAANYYFQPVSGFFKPWYQASLGLNRVKFNKSNIRDSFFLDASLEAGKRFTHKLNATIAYTYSERFSDEKVFDLVNHGISTNLEYQHSRTLIFFAAYKIQSGDVVSTATPNAKIRAAAETVAPDDAFSHGIGPGCLNRRCAYRLDATSHLLNAGINKTIGQNATIELATQYHHSDADGGNRYQGLIYHANVWYAF
jgi:hypothetical protein